MHCEDLASRLLGDVARFTKACIIEELFPAVVVKLGLHWHGSVVCDAPHALIKTKGTG